MASVLVEAQTGRDGYIETETDIVLSKRQAGAGDSQDRSLLLSPLKLTREHYAPQHFPGATEVGCIE